MLHWRTCRRGDTGSIRAGLWEGELGDSLVTWPRTQKCAAASTPSIGCAQDHTPKHPVPNWGDSWAQPCPGDKMADEGYWKEVFQSGTNYEFSMIPWIALRPCPHGQPLNRWSLVSHEKNENAWVWDRDWVEGEDLVKVGEDGSDSTWPDV